MLNKSQVVPPWTRSTLSVRQLAVQTRPCPASDVSIGEFLLHLRDTTVGFLAAAEITGVHASTIHTNYELLHLPFYPLAPNQHEHSTSLSDLTSTLAPFTHCGPGSPIDSRGYKYLGNQLLPTFGHEWLLILGTILIYKSELFLLEPSIHKSKVKTQLCTTFP